MSRTGFRIRACCCSSRERRLGAGPPSAGRLAVECEAVVALLGQVPGRSSADSLSAGAWIRRTLELAVEDGDDSWPLLFPMTKCVIRAMDAVTEFCAEMLGRKAGGFVVGGAAEQG